jgi:DivIVA domain-containing protein
MTEEYSSISSSRLSASEVSRASFAVVRRGFEPREVRSYLDYVARELEAWEDREAEMRRMIAAAEQRAEHPVIDESTLTAALGAQSAEILRTAHEEAHQLREESQAQAREMVETVQTRIAEAAVDAEQKVAARVGDAEIAATNLTNEAAQQAERLIAQARADGETLVGRAREQGRAMIEQAQEARAAVLAEMNQRRRTMHLQIEQLRAARDELARSVLGVRDTVDRLTAELSSSDAQARAAAEEVARRQPTSATIEADPEAATALDEEAVLDDDVSGDSVVADLFAKIRASAREGDSGETVDEAQEEPAPAGTDASVRDQMLEGPQSALSRKLKRILQDEQNLLLDRLRAESADQIILDDPAAQAQRIAGAAVDPLRDAADAGVTFAVERGAPQGPGLSRDAIGLMASELARDVVVPLGRRILEALESSDPTVEINAAFREWRGQRIERMAADAALESFSAAVVGVVGDGSVRWITEGSSSPCPDCADNALEGAVRAGSTFPTGQPHPPAHGGCRCAVVPSS